MNISVFGIGYVGCISLGCLAAEGNYVIGVDANSVKIEQINSGKATVVEKDIDKIISEQFFKGNIKATDDFNYAVQNSEISIICVGTPSNNDGNLNLSYILNVAGQIGEALKSKKDFHIISVRSSVPPGTIAKIENEIAKASNKIIDKDFSVLINPEFLREGAAVEDYYNPPYTLIGGNNRQAMDKLAELYKNIKAEILFTEVHYGEMIKFINNSFHALKVSFANEVGTICSELKIDSHKLMEIFCKDNKLNISNAYLKPGFAYGGSCLPKDLKALKTIAKELLIESPVIKSIDKSNETLIKKVAKLITSQNKKNIGFLGVTFKEGTDDLRNSPYLSLIEKIVTLGNFNIKIFDDNINLEKLTGANKQFLFEHFPEISSYLVSSFDELFEQSDVIVVSNKSHVKKIKNLNDKVVIDLVRIDDDLKTNDNYIGICW